MHRVSVFQFHCLSVYCGRFLPPSPSVGDWCVPCSQHLPIPLLACATLHLQWIKSEPQESTEKKDKKIGPNENQKHGLSLSPLLPWTWKEERGGELNLIQTSSAQSQMTGLWSVSVRVWVFRSLILPLLLLSSSFLWTKGESLQALQVNL